MELPQGIKYIGVNDREIDLFEGQYSVPNGMAYNSYAVIGEKIAIMDTVDKRFVPQWLENIETALGGVSPDYLIIQHMEPDHSAGIAIFAEKYPEATIVASAKAFPMMKNFLGFDPTPRQMIATEGGKLDLGGRELTFFSAPMVHWPEVTVTYDEQTKTLFSADAFGKFGALDTDEDWACEARRYYFGIVGKYGAQVQALLKKANALDIQTVCALHGPVLSGDALKTAFEKYQTWSAYLPEDDGVTIAYASIYGNTKKAAEFLAETLESMGKKVSLFDLARDDMAEAVEDSFRYSTLVLASSTYNNGLFPYMHTFINALTERNFQNRKVGFIENGSWAPTSGKNMRALLENSKNLTFAETTVTVRSALSDESREAIKALAEELVK